MHLRERQVPTAFAHHELTVVGGIEGVRIVETDHLVATHRRCWEKERTTFDPRHYLALLERKRGAFDVARSLQDWELPGCFAFLRQRLEADLDHTKILLVDPLGADPTVITGSANFSPDSTSTNDENMLVIQGDKEVADVYFSEFTRIFQHFYARWWASQLSKGPDDAQTHSFLVETDAWQTPYMTVANPKQLVRTMLHSRGPGNVVKRPRGIVRGFLGSRKARPKLLALAGRNRPECPDRADP